MAEEEEINKALNTLSELGFNRILRTEQMSSIKQLMRGGDLLAVLPTGFGKSLIFQILAMAKEHSHVLVICPLKSIIKDQILEASSIGLTASSLPECDLSEMESGEFQLLFASAEDALQKEFLSSLKNDKTTFHQNLAAIVIDESHTVETWTGKRSKKNMLKKTVAFRECFGQLSILRSFCREGTPMAALTGTADQNTQKTIKEVLTLKENMLTVYVSPNRTNLRFSVKKVKKERQLNELQWLIEIVKEKGNDTPKTIIFCNTMNDIASVTNHLLRQLGIDAYDQKLKLPENCYISVYHSNSWQTSKDRITASLKGNGLKRIVVATTALCMGVNFPNIRYIINWGAARSILDLHQEAGRAGRDGLQSHVIVIYHGQQIGPSEPEVKNFVRSKGCLRKAAYHSLDPDIETLSPLHNCCSYCTTVCECGGISCDACILPFETDTCTSDIQDRPEVCTRKVTPKDRQDLRSALGEVFHDMKGQGLAIDESVSHGFSNQLIDDVVQNCDTIFTIEDVLSNYPVFSVGNALRILEIIQELFLDLPNLEETLTFFSFGSNVDSDTWFNIKDYLFDDSSDEEEQILNL